MSALEIVGLFTVIFATGLSIAAMLIAFGVAAMQVYRWSLRGKHEEDLDLRDALRMKQDFREAGAQR